MARSALTIQAEAEIIERMKLSVIIPAYNEESRLPVTLAATFAYLKGKDAEMIVVDDGSSDGTADLVRSFAAAHTELPVSVVSYGGNRGKGYAVRYGMTHATGEWRLFCDADLATPIEEYDVLMERLLAEKAEIAIGSRPLKDSKLDVHEVWYREVLGRLFNQAVQLLAVRGIEDTQCGFKVFSAKAADDIFPRCRIDRYAFDAEALYLAKKLGYAILEVPIRWSHQEGSKVNVFRDGMRMGWDLLRMRVWHYRT